MSQNKKTNALIIIKTLLAGGHAAFFAGGCVRDMLMGNIPEDFDIATSANPDEIIRLAGEKSWKTITVGQVFGVIVIVIDGCQYEVSTFRADTYGQDSHRPVSVRPVDRIEDDLARRDFTINAMAMDIDGALADPFGGVSDLAGKTVRAVGNPDERFAEDALRMFRAIRFAARFNFIIEPATFAAIAKNLNRAQGLSAERVTAEIEKILVSGNPAAGVRLLAASGLAAQVCRVRVKKEDLTVDILPELQYLPVTAPAKLALLSDTPRQITLRWTALLYLIAKGIRFNLNKETGAKRYCRTQPELQDIEKTLAVLARLKIKSAQIKIITWLLKNYQALPPNRHLAVRGWLGAISRDFSSQQEMRKNLAYLLTLHKAGRKSSPLGLCRLKSLTGKINQELKTVPFFTGQLAVSGKEIAAKLGVGSQVKQFQLDALAKIQNGVLKNSPFDLLKLLESKKLEQNQSF